MKMMLMVLVMSLTFLLSVKAHGGDDSESAFIENNSSNLANRKIELEEEGMRGAGVQLISVEKSSLKKFIKSTGQVQAAYNNYYDLSSPVSGLVSGVYVKEGDSVYKGQTLASIQSIEATNLLRDLLNQKANLEREISIQTADLELKEQNFTREQTLLSEGISAQKDFASAQTAYLNAQAALTATKKQLDLNLATGKSQLGIMGISNYVVDSALEYGEIESTVSIVAPMNGTVAFRDLTLGENIQPNKKVFSIVNLSPIWILVDIFQEQIPLIKIGQEVNVISASGEKVKAKVANLGVTVDPQSRTLSARIVSDNPQAALKPGMTVIAEIIYGNSEKKSIVIPESALVKDGDGFLVFIKDENYFKLIPIKVGNGFDEKIEVLEGLEEGDQIVIHGTEQLKAQLLLSGDSDHGDHSHGDNSNSTPFNSPLILGSIVLLISGLGFWFYLNKKRKVK